MLKDLEKGALDSINQAKKDLDKLAKKYNTTEDLVDFEDLAADVLEIQGTLSEALTIQLGKA